MKTILPEQITTIAEVEHFIESLWKNDEFFHLDDPPEEIYTPAEERAFTDEEAAKIKALLEQSFALCEVWELPIITKILDAIYRQWEREQQEPETKVFNAMQGGTD